MFSGKFNKYTKYTVNGKEYSSLNEVPEEFRSVFNDQNGNGIPDSIEKMMENASVGGNFSGNVEVQQVDGKMKYFYNGKEYDSPDALPPEFRKIIQDNNGNGLPGLYESLCAKMGNNLLQGASATGKKIVDVKDVDVLEIPRQMAPSKLHLPETCKSSAYGERRYDYGDYGKPKSNTALFMGIAFIGGVLLAVAAIILYMKYFR